MERARRLAGRVKPKALNLSTRRPEVLPQPTSGGTNSIMVCHDIVITLVLPLCAVVSSSTGPGSSRP